MVHYKNYNEHKEDSTMREIHRIQEEMEQQYKKSGISSYWEWLQATEQDMHQSFAEVGYEIVTRDGRTFLDEIKAYPKKNINHRKIAKARKKNSPPSSHSTKPQIAQHKNYADDIEDSSLRELSVIREEIEQRDKYKITPKRKKTKPRKK